MDKDHATLNTADISMERWTTENTELHMGLYKGPATDWERRREGGHGSSKKRREVREHGKQLSFSLPVPDSAHKYAVSKGHAIKVSIMWQRWGQCWKLWLKSDQPNSVDERQSISFSGALIGCLLLSPVPTCVHYNIATKPHFYTLIYSHCWRVT